MITFIGKHATWLFLSLVVIVIGLASWLTEISSKGILVLTGSVVVLLIGLVIFDWCENKHFEKVVEDSKHTKG